MGITIKQLVKVGKDTLRLSRKFPEYRRNETALHGVMLGLLEGDVGSMGREKTTKWGRIDFRHGGSNPALIELAIRDNYNRNQLYGSQNKPELNKLCRIPFERARRRVLLLLDASDLNPISKERLIATYSKIRSTRGRFTRSSVRVIYVHREINYSFIWKPTK